MEDLLRAIVIAYENYSLSISDQVEGGVEPVCPVSRETRE
jgi:hypothetical protein